MTDEEGLSLIELLVVMFLASLLISVTIISTLPWLGREELRSSAREIQTHLQLARIQSVARNRACRFVLDPSSRRMQVVDLNDPTSYTDDIVLDDSTLSSRLSFSRPDTGSAITLATMTGGLYQATFSPDGSVSEGAGEIVIHGGDRYDRVSLHAAGGGRVDRWDGAAWVSGS